jgi:hypothetical protein
MFQDVALGSIGFKSKCTKTMKHAETATEPIEYVENSTDPRFGVVDGSTQTDPKATASSTAGKKDKKDTTDEDNATRRRVLESLERVGPTMLRELATNGTTSAYFAGKKSRQRWVLQTTKSTHACVVVGFEKYLEASAETNIAKLFQLKFDYDTYFVQAPSQPQGTGCHFAASIAFSYEPNSHAAAAPCSLKQQYCEKDRASGVLVAQAFVHGRVVERNGIRHRCRLRPL